MPLPDFSAEMSQIENEKNAPSVEPVEENPEPVIEESLTEEEIFKKQKREKLLNHLAECRKLSAAKRKAQKEEKQKNKKPRGRPKKNPQEENVIISEASPVQELPPPPATPVVKELPAKPHYPIPPDIDYDRIIDGVHQKYLKSKAERKAKKAPAPAPAPTMVYQPPAPAQPAFDKSAFEAQIREDERNRIRGEVQRKKQEQEALKQRTKDYYSRLPPRSLAAGKNWDEYFFA
jgi:hypothetical protein